jgi:RimJ/RimL family protein N-acetyltransferase
VVPAITFEPTHDLALIRSIFVHPRVWPYISDDGSPAVENFQPIDHAGVLYLLAFDGETLLGLWMFVQQNAVTVEVHTALLPGHGYRRGREAARGAAEWIWAHTKCQRIFTNVPACNRIARKFAEAAGMTEFGTNFKSYLKNKVLQDQTLLGISRPKENTMLNQVEN